MSAVVYFGVPIVCVLVVLAVAEYAWCTRESHKPLTATDEECARIDAELDRMARR